MNVELIERDIDAELVEGALYLLHHIEVYVPIVFRSYPYSEAYLYCAVGVLRYNNCGSRIGKDPFVCLCASVKDFLCNVDVGRI